MTPGRARCVPSSEAPSGAVPRRVENVDRREAVIFDDTDLRPPASERTEYKWAEIDWERVRRNIEDGKEE